MSLSSTFKNASPYWIGCTVYASWFLFGHAPYYVVKEGKLSHGHLMMHLLGAYPCYLACIFNTLITPSLFGGKAKGIHTWVGRYGMIMGLLAFPFGVVYHRQAVQVPFFLFFAIVLSSTYQLSAQYFGYTTIRKYKQLKQQLEEIQKEALKNGSQETTAKQENVEPTTPVVTPETVELLKQQRDKALSDHIYYMIILFSVGCAVPGGIRFFMLTFGFHTEMAFTLSFFGLLFTRPFHYCYYQKTKINVSGNPITNVFKILDGVLGKLYKGEESIHYKQVARQLFYQAFLLSNMPGITPTPVLANRTSTNNEKTNSDQWSDYFLYKLVTGQQPEKEKAM